MLTISTIRTSFKASLISTLILLFLLGCSTLPPEPPLCYYRDFVLEQVSVADQRALRAASSEGFEILALNDLTLKSYVRVLEGTLDAHNEPLGGCDD